MMNCHSVTHWLNDRDPADLSAAENAALKAHIAKCPDCAEQCSISAGVASFRSEVPPLPSSLHERAWQLQALRDSKASRRRTRRPIIVGSLLLLGAAATMFATVPFSDTSPAER